MQICGGMLPEIKEETWLRNTRCETGGNKWKRIGIPSLGEEQVGNNCIMLGRAQRKFGTALWACALRVRWSRGGPEWTFLVLASSTSIPSLFHFGLWCFLGSTQQQWHWQSGCTPSLCHLVNLWLRLPQCHPLLQSCPEGNVQSGGVLSLFSPPCLKLFWSQWAKGQCRIQIKFLL